MSAAPLPPPLVPAEVDLRDFGFMPLDVTRLFNSRFHAIASDSEWRAGVTLWCKSWQQVPCGSIPDDDVELCRLAELGRDVRAWRKVRANALHGWVKCSDGRMYHPVVAEKAADAWAKKRKASAKGKLGNEKRWGKLRYTAEPEGGESGGGRPAAHAGGDGEKIDAAIAQGFAEGSPGDRKGQGEGEGQGLKSKGDQARALSPRAAVVMAMKRVEGLDFTRMNTADPRLAAFVDQGATPEEFEGIAREAVEKGIAAPLGWIIAALAGRRAQAAATQLAAPVRKTAADRRDEKLDALTGKDRNNAKREPAGDFVDVDARRID